MEDINTHEKSPEIDGLLIEGEIDLIGILKRVWATKRTIYYNIGFFFLIGLIIALVSPTKYKASAILLPSAERDMGKLGSLGALAGLAGINIGSVMGESSSIPADIYPQIVASYPFLNEFINETFTFLDYETPISVYDYLVADTIESFGGTLLKYTIRLPWTLKEIMRSSDEEEGKDEVVTGVLSLTDDEQKAIGFVKDLIHIDVDKETGLVTISAEGAEPILTAQYVKKAVDLLQKYIIEYKTKQVRETLDFVSDQYDEKKVEYEVAQKAFFNYKDDHRNVIAERMESEYQQLSDQYEIASSVYKGLSQQLEQAKISVKERTPVFTVLEPVQVPFEKSAPKRKVILFISILLGSFTGLFMILLKIFLEKFKEAWG